MSQPPKEELAGVAKIWFFFSVPFLAAGALKTTPKGIQYLSFAFEEELKAANPSGGGR